MAAKSPSPYVSVPNFAVRLTSEPISHHWHRPELTPELREHVLRLKIRLVALRRHETARDLLTGKGGLAVAAGKASGRVRQGDSAFGLELALKRWYPEATPG